MNLIDMTRAIEARQIEAEGFSTFGGNYADHYDISNMEAERIAERANSVEEFEAIWSNESWWRDAE